MRARVLIGLLALALATASLVGAAGAASAAQEGGEKLSHDAELCIEKLEDGGEPEDCAEAPSPILPEANEMIYGGLAFFILLVLMWKFAYPGIKKGMDARSQAIRATLDEADQAKTEAGSVLEEYQRQLADAKSESARIIEEARQTAEQMRRDLMARAEAEVAELRQRSQDDIVAAQQRALADLRAQVATLAIELAEKVVEKNLDRDTNIALIESYINQVGADR